MKQQVNPVVAVIVVLVVVVVVAMIWIQASKPKATDSSMNPEMMKQQMQQKMKGMRGQSPGGARLPADSQSPAPEAKSP